MIYPTSFPRFLTGAVLLTATLALAGCGGSERVTKTTTTTEQTTNSVPVQPTSSSSTSTTTRQVGE